MLNCQKNRQLSHLIFFILAMTLPGSSQALSLDQVAQLRYEPNQTSVGQFIEPNEQHSFLYEDANQGKKGVLISVGTFRSLVAASYGEFDEVILADLDEKVVNFNKKQIKTLSDSSSAAQFLAKILNRPELSDEIQEILTASDPHLNSLFWTKHLKSDLRIEARYVQAILKYSLNDPSSSFLKSSRAFQKLRQLALNGRMHSITADLSGSVVFSQLALQLQVEGQNVSVIDVSNVPDYMVENSKFPEFIENLSLLPLSADAIINFTSIHKPAQSQFISGWIYSSLGVREFINMAKNHRIDSNEEYVQFLNSIPQSNLRLTSEPLCKKVFR